MFQSIPQPPLALITRVMLTIWFIILPPWMFGGLIGTGMAFEGGDRLDTYLFILVVWSYPILVAIAFYSRRKWPQLVWLPLLTGLLMVIEQFAWEFTNR